MKDFIQWLQDAFPALRNHPRLSLALFLVLLILGFVYRAKDRRKQLCQYLCAKLLRQAFITTRWLYVHQNSMNTDDWKYYTSEVTGKGDYGDDVIWTLVSWPSLRPKDTFRVPGAVGMVSGIHDSQTKLEARWNIIHDPDAPGIGPVPARGAKSMVRRFLIRLAHLVGSI